MRKMVKKKFHVPGLTLIFALIIFSILFITISINLMGMALLHTLGLLERHNPSMRIFMFAFASLIVGTIIAFLFSGYCLRPIRELMDAVDKIADGDFSPRVNLTGIEEFRQLSQKFNHMAEELGSVEMLRSDFVNNFSHEFKTPIVSIRGFAKMLQRDDLTEAEREEYLETIVAESERLTALATNVLSLSKIEGQSILTDKKRVNISEQIRLAIALLDGKWGNKAINFDFDCGEYYITGNEELLKQGWINLLDNAIKFSPVGGTVTIRITEIMSGIKVSITNEGEGIPEKSLAHIFDKFYQGDTSHAGKGNGLGLAITKKIVNLHGGTIEAISGNRGTTFEIELYM